MHSARSDWARAHMLSVREFPRPSGFDFVAPHQISNLIPALLQKPRLQTATEALERDRNKETKSVRMNFGPTRPKFIHAPQIGPAYRCDMCLLFKTKGRLTGGGCKWPPGTMPAQRTRNRQRIVYLCPMLDRECSPRRASYLDALIERRQDLRYSRSHFGSNSSCHHLFCTEYQLATMRRMPPDGLCISRCEVRTASRIVC